jgi:uncharacterized protein (TIGR03083 family)
VHRWAARIVRDALAKSDGVVAEAPGDGELLDWYREGHRALVETLRAAPDDLECFAFLPAPSPKAFWARRQAMETAIHRADAEGAIGSVTPYDETLALDGIEELLFGFGSRMPEKFDPATFRFEVVSGPSWLVRLESPRLEPVRDGAGAADVTVSGSASEVFRWLWNRPADVSVDGDVTRAAEWGKFAIRWG